MRTDRSALLSARPLTGLPLAALRLATAIVCASPLSACQQTAFYQQPPDFAFGFNDDDAGAPDLSAARPDDCKDGDPACMHFRLGPAAGSPFPLSTDPMKDPGERDRGLARDADGYLVPAIDSSYKSYFAWTANTTDWNIGTVSRLDTRTVREVARYFTVTCNSLKTGSQQQCDGLNGCCSADDIARFMARQQKMAMPPHQAVQMSNNGPSRTAVDRDGSVFVVNHAFGKGQSSLTKIAADPTQCRDINKNGKIETSSDRNADGLIETDCNDDGLPDDIASVKQKPCINGLKQEFYGLDDECILWTSNVGVGAQFARSVELGDGADPAVSSDAWVAMQDRGWVFRVDGVTGLQKDWAQLPPECMNLFAATIDRFGIGWVSPLITGRLCYFDTRNTRNVGSVRDPDWGLVESFGLAPDRDGNLWMAGGARSAVAQRYVPDRTNGFKNLGMGWWTRIVDAGAAAGAQTGRGIAADARTAMSFQVWLASDNGYVVQLPGSSLPLSKMDSTVQGAMFPAVRMAGTWMSGIGVDEDQNLVTVSAMPAVVTRARVSNIGSLIAPDINGVPMGKDRCPAGDTCNLKDNMTSDPSPDTYSDLTGFSLRHFQPVQSVYSYVVSGCKTGDTRWFTATWWADVPQGTIVRARARTGASPIPDSYWSGWSFDWTNSPTDLRASPLGFPPDQFDQYLQIEFSLLAFNGVTPKLKSFDLSFRCD